MSVPDKISLEQKIATEKKAIKLVMLGDLIMAVFAQVPVEDIKLRALQEGRMIYVQAYVQLKSQTPFDLEQQDAYRKVLYQQLKQDNDYLSLDVIYTAQPIWVARSVGDEAR